MANTEELPPDLAALREGYAELFGEVPPLPEAKFGFFSRVDPEALRRAEEARARAFHNEVFDGKTTQLMVFGMLLALGGGAAKWHAIAAHRQGANWQELALVVELASVLLSLGPFNTGGAVLEELRDSEDGT